MAKIYAPYKTGRDALTEKNVNDLLESFSNLQEKAIIHLAVSCGLRRTDIVNVNRNDINLETSELTYYEHKKNRTRTIMIPSSAALHTLRMHVNSCKKSKWLFPSPLKRKTDEHVSDRHVYDIFNEHLDVIKVRRRPFHSLRATCIKMCERAGWKDYETAELVGDTVRVIQEHYSTPSVQEMHELARDKQIL